MTKEFLQSVAAQWYNGQHSALYAYASTQTILPGLQHEIKECLQNAKACDRTSLCKMYVSTAPQLTAADLLTVHEFWYRTMTNADGTPARCRKTGKLKTWKTRPQDFKLPVRHGLRNNFYLTPENIGEWCQAL